jgi:ATP synthase protein I
MSQPPSPGQPPQGGGDPWAAFGYLVAGVGVYGLLGWGLGVWLHASYLTPVGILLGAALGLALVFYQFGRAPSADDDAPSTTNTVSEPGPPPPGQSTDDDRGVTE